VNKLRQAVLLLVALLPWVIKKQVLSRAFGYRFDQGAYIGLALVDVRDLQMGAGSSIGSFTVIRNLAKLKLGEKAKIGTFNWVFGTLANGPHFAKERNRLSALIVGDHSAVTSRHIVDCIDQVEIGKFTIIAGFWSQLLTHSVDIRNNRQGCAPIKIGSYCFVGTGVIILKGTIIPDYCVVSAGSVVTKSLPGSGFIYGGNPVKKIRAIDQDTGYFCRVTGNII
jgi:acetyltransferase-like isoleucine patch superfamily enzyme